MRINPYGYLNTTFLNQQILNPIKPNEPHMTRERIEVLFYDVKAELRQHYEHLGQTIDLSA
jgi:hypothetical protein|tara:strand:- start:331 stop:513 length:183 start_codon:yes stop_codon:yes gene_type:complete